MFAEATGDHQWIHLDAERTQKELGMPTIAHGFDPVLAAGSVGADFRRQKRRGINYGSNKTRFTSMVPVNSKLRARAKLVGVEPKAGGVLFTSASRLKWKARYAGTGYESLTLLFE